MAFDTSDIATGLFGQIGGATVDAAGNVFEALPPGGLKDWLNSLLDPAKFFGKVIDLIKGRTYTTGQYVLGERYVDQIIGADHDVTRGEIPDDIVPTATIFFTIVFGVRITTSEDLDALDYGVEAYYKRPEKDDIPLDAVKRAVFLKQNFFPISTYNRGVWDVGLFEQYPLVAPIPGVQYKTLYSGKVPGGAVARNGVIVQGSSPLVEGSKTSVSTKTWLWIGGGIVLLILIVLLFLYLKKHKS